MAAQALVDEARGTLGERGWRTRGGDAASYDDISVFVVPLGKHKDIKKYIKEERPVSALVRDDSFVKKYVNRDEVEIRTAKSLAEELNSNKENDESRQDDADAKFEEEVANFEKTLLSTGIPENEAN